jgi:hypothetical protein
MTRLFQSIVISSLFLIAACGGGGGGGDDVSEPISDEPIAYTGLKTAAFINPSNAKVFVEGIFGSGLEGSVDDVIGVVTEESADEENLPANLILLQSLANASQHIDITSAAVLPGTIQTNTQTEPCESGSMTISVQVDDVTGAFTGTLTFDECLLSGVYTDGIIDATGTFDLALFEVTEITMNFSDLTQTYGAESYTYSGQVIMQYSGSTITQLCDYLVRDNNTGIVYMYSDCTNEMIDTGTEVRMSLSGRFYHPDYGYVDVNTDPDHPILMRYDEEWPYMGVVIALGEASSLMVNCEGMDSLTYTLSVDADGDGNYESVTIENW